MSYKDAKTDDEIDVEENKIKLKSSKSLNKGPGTSGVSQVKLKPSKSMSTKEGGSDWNKFWKKFVRKSQSPQPTAAELVGFQNIASEGVKKESVDNVEASKNGDTKSKDGSPSPGDTVNLLQKDFSLDLDYVKCLLCQKWTQENQGNFLSQLDQCSTNIGNRVDDYTSLVHAGALPGTVLAERKVLLETHGHLKVAHTDFNLWLAGIPRETYVIVNVDTGKSFLEKLSTFSKEFFHEVENIASKKPKKSKVGTSKFTPEDRALIENLKRLNSVSPPPKPPLPDGIDPIAAFMTSLPEYPDDVFKPANPKIYETLDSVTRQEGTQNGQDTMQSSFVDGMELEVNHKPPIWNVMSKPRSLTLPCEMHSTQGAQFVENALAFHQHMTQQNGVDATLTPDTVCAPLTVTSRPLPPSANLPRPPSSPNEPREGTPRRGPLPAPPVDELEEITSPRRPNEKCRPGFRFDQRVSGFDNETNRTCPNGRDCRQMPSTHRCSCGGPEARLSVSSSGLRDDESGEEAEAPTLSEGDELRRLQEGPLYRTEVKSDTENSEKIIFVNGKKYRQHYKKHIVMERHLIKKVIHARVKPDGSGPDIDLDSIDFTADLPDSLVSSLTNSTIQSPTSSSFPVSTSSSILPPSSFKLSNPPVGKMAPQPIYFADDPWADASPTDEYRPRTASEESGNDTMGSAISNLPTYVTRPTRTQSDAAIVDLAGSSEPQKPPPPTEPLKNYMYRFGPTPYTEPMDNLSNLFDFFRSQWNKTETSSSPADRTKTISYVQRYTQQTPDGDVIHRSIGVQQTRRVKMGPMIPVVSEESADAVQIKTIPPTPDPDQPVSPLSPSGDTTKASPRSHSSSALDRSQHAKSSSISSMSSTGSVDLTTQPPEAGQEPYFQHHSVLRNSSTKSGEANSPFSSSPGISKQQKLADLQFLESLESHHHDTSYVPSMCPLRGSWSSILEKINATPYILFTNSKDLAMSGSSPEITVKAGCVDALIVYATQIGKVTPDYYLFYETFLVTYRTFIRPEELVDKLINRYNFFSQNKSEEFTEMERVKVCRSTVAFLTTIVSKLKRDMTPALYNRLNEFSDQMRTVDKAILADKLTSYVHQQVEARERFEKAIRSPSIPLAASKVTVKPSCLLDLPSRTVAEQMTLLESEIFDKIEIPELLDIKAVEKERNPLLTSCVVHFNTVTNWAKTLILSDDRKSQTERERYMTKFLEIMEHLRDLRNFASYLALHCALISIPECLITKKMKIKLERIRDYMRPPGFHEYRRELEKAPLPCIPYMGLIFQHLIQLAQGNLLYLDPHPDHPQGGAMVNFWRCWKHFLIISFFVKKDISDSVKSRYQIQPNEEVLSFINNFHDLLSESSLEALSAKLVKELRAASK